jgi:hypothetical protein
MNKVQTLYKIRENFEKNPRANNKETGYCDYLGPNGEKCAVGMFFIEGSILKTVIAGIDYEYSPEMATNISVDVIVNLDEILIPEVRGFGMDFWRSAQHFHDCDKFWEKNSDGGNILTQDGLNKFNDLLEMFKN